MSKIHKSALVSYSAEQMFTLVNDFESYPEFMPGCVGAELLSQGEGWIEARLDLAKSGFTQSFVTRNQLSPPTSMKIDLVEGPFSRFSGEWLFSELSDGACKVEFRLDFAFKNPLLGLAIGKVLEQVAGEQVECVCQRAKTIYN